MQADLRYNNDNSRIPKKTSSRIPKSTHARIPEAYPLSHPSYITDRRPQTAGQANLIQSIQCSPNRYHPGSFPPTSPETHQEVPAKPAFTPDISPSGKTASEASGAVIQGVLEIQSARPQSVFNRLTYKQFHALTKRKKGQKRMKVPIDAWLYMRKLAERKKVYTFKTWREAVQSASDRPVKRIQAREEAKRYLETLQCVRIGFVEGINFGNIMSGLALVRSLQELGYSGRITFVCSDSVRAKIIQLQPALQEMAFERNDEFSVGADYAPPEVIADNTLSFMANGDFLDDAETNPQLLNYLQANICVIMNPYGWKHGNTRRVLRRTSPNDEVEETLMEPELNAEALYVRSLESPKDLSKFITDQLGPENQEKKEGLLALVGAAKSSRIFLQPVYGLHTLDETGLVNAEATLSEGVHRSKASQKPTILLMLNKARIDYVPPYAQPWLFRGNIAQQGIQQQIEKLKAGEILILDCLGLPDAIFTQVFKLASLPPLIEGANTSNLVQLIGKPWMSPRTNTTEFPFADRREYKPVLDFLHQVRDALTAGSSLTEKIEDAPEHTDITDLSTLLVRIRQIDYFLTKANGLTENDLGVFLKELQKARNLGITAAGTFIDKIEEYTSGRATQSRQQAEDALRPIEMNVYSELRKLDFSLLKNEVETKLKAIKDSLSMKLGDGGEDSYHLDFQNIQAITQMIDQSLDPGSELRRYFAEVHESTGEDERNQVLQGILLVLKSRAGVAGPE